MTIYERIRGLRISKGMTQDDLAHAMGYKDRSMITKIESGKVDISQSKIIEFAKALGTTPGYLMGWSEQKREFTVFVPSPDFVKMTKYMTQEDYENVVKAFERAYERMKELGESLDD